MNRVPRFLCAALVAGALCVVGGCTPGDRPGSANVSPDESRSHVPDPSRMGRKDGPPPGVPGGAQPNPNPAPPQ